MMFCFVFSKPAASTKTSAIGFPVVLYIDAVSCSWGCSAWERPVPIRPTFFKLTRVPLPLPLPPQGSTGPQGSLGNLGICEFLLGFLRYFYDFLWNIRVFGQNNVIFQLLQQKGCRIIYKFHQNTISGPETCKIGPKLWLQSCPDLLLTP